MVWLTSWGLCSSFDPLWKHPVKLKTHSAKPKARIWLLEIWSSQLIRPVENNWLQKFSDWPWTHISLSSQDHNMWINDRFISWVPTMRYVFYTLCPIPVICLYLSMRWPNGYIGGGESIRLSASPLAFCFSIFLTLSGTIGIATLSERRSKAGLLIATSIAALPAIFFVFGHFFVEINRN